MTAAGDDTSDEDREAGEIRRMPRGSGWWGAGPPLATRKKGLTRPISRSGGFPFPGRWPVDSRRIPDSPVLD